jgi:hypothetical protein
VRTLLANRDAEVQRYVRQDVVRTMLLQPPPERRPRGWGWAVWRLVGVECWLRAEGDSTFLDRMREPR